LTISGSEYDIRGKDELFGLLSSNVPVYLSFDGKGLIHKMIHTMDEGSKLSQILPNAKQGEFFEQTIELDDHQYMVSVVRTEIIKSIIQEFRDKSIFVIGCCLGPFSLHNILPYLNVIDQQWSIGNYQLLVEKGHIHQTEIVPAPPTISSISFGGETVSEAVIISYGNALSHFVGAVSAAVFSEDLLNQYKQDFAYRRLYKSSVACWLVFVFLGLLINFLLFTSYNKKYIRSEQIYQSGISLVNTLNALEKDLDAKRQLFQQNYAYSDISLSYLTDRIGATIPPDIRLIKMDLHPPITTKGLDDVFQFEINQVVVVGESKNSAVLENWLSLIRHEKWLKKLEIVQYKQESIGNTGSFTLKITL
jgi:hypothetical protein